MWRNVNVLLMFCAQLKHDGSGGKIVHGNDDIQCIAEIQQRDDFDQGQDVTVNSPPKRLISKRFMSVFFNHNNQM